MAVAYDNFGASATGTGTRTITGFTPVGTPRGIIAFVIQNNGTDEISGVTYGGVAMTEVAGSPNLHTTGEAAAVYCYFLGASIPTGAQDVVATASGTTATKILYVYSLTAAADTETVDVDATINSDSVADPSVTLSLGGRTSFACITFCSGQGAGSGTTPLTSWTSRNEFAAGGLVIASYSYDTVGTSDVTAGWTQTAEDAVAVAVAVSEVEPALTIQPGLGALSVAGAALSLAFSILPGLGSAPVTGYAPTVFQAHNRAIPAASAPITGYAPALASSVALPAGQLPVTGQAPTVTVQGMVIQVPVGALSIAGQYVAVAFMDPAPGALVVAGQAPALALGVGLPVGSLPVQGYVPQIVGAGAITPGVGALTVTGAAPGLALGVGLPAGALAATGQVPTSPQAEFLPLPVGQIVVTGYALSMNGAFVITLPAGQVPSTGYAPSAHLLCAVPSASVSVSGSAPIVEVPTVMAMSAGVVGFTGRLMTVQNSFVSNDPVALRSLSMSRRTERVLERSIG